jgi:DNA-binding transcriptional LysR family regulator
MKEDAFQILETRTMDRFEAMSVLLQVAETGSISAASRKLRTPLATVSRKVAELEQHLNTRLLMRSNRSVTLTPAGRAFVAASRRILTDLADAERVASGETKMMKGELTLSAPIALGRFYLLPVVVDFIKEHPNIDVRMMLVDRRVNMIEEHVDIGLRVGDLNDYSLVARKVGTVRRVVCASPAYLARRGVPKTPEDLKDHDCVTFENTLSSEHWIFRIGKTERSFPIHSRLVVSTAEAATDAAVAGLGLTRMLDYQIDALRRKGALQLVLESFRAPHKSVHLIYEAGPHLPLKVRTFVDFAAPRLKKRMNALGDR